MARNIIPPTGVYRGMRRVWVLLLSVAAMGQVPALDPFDTAIQDFWTAQSEVRFHDAARKRELARTLLAQVPPESPRFAERAQTVAQMFQNAGMTAKARTVLEEALARVPEVHSGRASILEALADLWHSDGNLLKSVACLEKSIAAAEAAAAAPPAPNGGAPNRAVAVGGVISGSRLMAIRGNFGMAQAPIVYRLQRLAMAYRELGRQADAAEIAERIKKLAGDDPDMLAQFYENQDDLERAAEQYRKKAASSADPQEAANSLQALAGLYQRQDRPDEAAAVLKQAIDGLMSSGKPEYRQQSLWIRQNLAGIMQQAGNTKAADALFQQNLAEAQGSQDGNYHSFLIQYANYLSQTERSARAESLLTDYMATQGNLEPWQEVNLLYGLSNAARAAGNNEGAQEYYRRAQQKQQAMQPQLAARVMISPDLNRAAEEANAGHSEDAFRMALQALEAAPKAADRGQIGWTLPQIASALADKGETAKAQQLFQRLFEVFEGWSDEDVQTTAAAWQGFARFLIGRKELWNQVPEAIDHYRDLLLGAHGPETGKLAEVLMLRLEFEEARGATEEAVRPAEEYLALEASLSGTTSDPYCQALERVAEVYDSAGNQERALALRKQAVGVADAVSPGASLMRGSVRVQAARTLAAMGQFEEAERLAREAVAIGEAVHPKAPEAFVADLKDIQRLRGAARKQ